MKNIIWQQPGGRVAVYSLPNDADSQAVAAELLASGSVDASWTAVLFDVQEFPGEPQAAWRCVDGALVFDPSAVPAQSKEQKIAHILATLGKGRDRSLIQTIILFAEEVSIPKLAANNNVSVEVAKAAAYASNPTYRAAVDCEAACRAIETAL